MIRFYCFIIFTLAGPFVGIMASFFLGRAIFACPSSDFPDYWNYVSIMAGVSMLVMHGVIGVTLLLDVNE